MENSSNVSDLICPPQITAEDSMFYEKFSFWTEGVIGCMIYFPGKEGPFKLQNESKAAYRVACRRLWNFIAVQVKFNEYLHPDVQIKGFIWI